MIFEKEVSRVANPVVLEQMRCRLWVRI